MSKAPIKKIERINGNPTYTQLLLLGALASSRNYGGALADQLELQRPMVYTALGRMVEMGLLIAETEEIDESLEGRRARIFYTITDSGRAVFIHSVARLVAFR